jgi:hypothetical protein
MDWQNGSDEEAHAAIKAIIEKSKNIEDYKYLEFSPIPNCLHFDIQPILFHGITQSSLPVVGSLFFEDENGDDWYLHAVVSPHFIKMMIDKTISYREILENAESVYLRCAFSASHGYEYHKIDFSALPESMKPTFKSFIM